MALFDQQPMGPVPARRSILMPPDPQLEALLADPVRAEIQVVEPIPRELVEGLAETSRSPVRHWFRRSLALLLLVPEGISFAVVIANLVVPGGTFEEGIRVPAVAVGGTLIVTMVAAQVVWIRRGWR